MRQIYALLAWLCLIWPCYAEETKALSLNEAVQFALKASPSVKGAQAEYGAAIGERRQAEAFLNPTLNFDAENISGTGVYGGSDGAELTAGLSQTVEIGGKRSARIKAADQGRVIAGYGQLAAKLDLVRDVKTGFANAAAAQEAAKVAVEQAATARQVYQAVNKRVKAAAAPIVQRNKAKILLANAELIAERAKGQKDAALKILSAWWNGGPLVLVDTSEFYTLQRPALSRDVQTQLQDSIDYRQQSARAQQARSLLNLEQANAIPNPSFGLGLRDFRATNDQALVASLSFPLPVFNLNRGNIEKARQLAVKVDTDRQKLLLDSQASLAESSQNLHNAWLTATRIKSVILPEAQQAFRQAQRGYTAGKFPYLEVLDAQRTLVDTKLAYIQALRDYHIEKAEVERLTAKGDAP